MTVIANRRTLCLGLSAALLTSACGLPRSGPSRREILDGGKVEGSNTFVVNVDGRVAQATTIQPGLGFNSAFTGTGRMGSDTISAGDTLSVSIWENVDQGVLTTRGAPTQLQEVQVDGNGNIFIPYAGKLKAAGNSPEALRDIITERLAAQTPDPQVSVARTAGDGATVSVMGNIAQQGVYAI
ncbi:MAG TPA: polysaccharide biosynthesis/export family protein [Paenirhodobacter sp.]